MDKNPPKILTFVEKFYHKAKKVIMVIGFIGTIKLYNTKLSNADNFISPSFYERIVDSNLVNGLKSKTSRSCVEVSISVPDNQLLSEYKVVIQ